MTGAFDSPLVCPVLIGRDACIEAIDRRLDDIQAGRGQTLLISGEAGIGKSRLITALSGRASALTAGVFKGSCFERDQSLPYAPIGDALRTLCNGLGLVDALERLGPDLATLLPELGVAGAAGDDPELARQRVVESLVRLLKDMAADHPLLVVFEDLHWSDAASLGVFGVLARRLRDEPILLVGTYRDDEQHASLATLLAELGRGRLASELRLPRLGPDHVEAMLRSIFGSTRAVRPSLVRRLYDLTDGNPFFVEEVLRSLVAVTPVSPTPDWEHVRLDDLRLPRSVQDAVQRRTDRLSPVARSVVVLAAITGRRFEFPLLEQLSELGEGTLLGAIKELIGAQLVVEESLDTFAFRHALTRQAIHTLLLARERRVIHQRVAIVLEQQSRGERVEDLAYHFFEAGDWPKAAEYAERAGRRAQLLYAAIAAAEHFSTAIAALTHQGARVPGRLYRQRALAHEINGAFDPALADHERSLRAAHADNDASSECQALLDLGFLWAGRDYSRTGDYFARALSLARTLDQPVALASALNRVGNWHANVEQPTLAVSLHHEALAIFERQQDMRGVAQTLDLLGLATCFLGDLVVAVGLYDRAITLHRELDDRLALCSSLSVLAVAGGGGSSWNVSPTTVQAARDALANAEEALQLARAIGSRASECFAGHCWGQAASGRGEYARALDVVSGCLELSHEIAHEQWSCALHFIMGTLLRDVGALDSALVHAQQAVTLARSIGSLFWTRIAGSALVELQVIRGDLEAAGDLDWTLLPEAEEPSTIAARHVCMARARLALARGDPRLARSLLEMLVRAGRTPMLDLLYAEVLLALGNPQDAEACLRKALAVAEDMQQRAVVWRLYAMLGRVCSASGQPAQAQRARDSAERIALAIANDVPDELRGGFLALAQHAMGRSARRFRRDRAGLTAREREVARLVSAGLSNRAIAEQLVLGERTIETHVSAILNRLQLTNRAQLAAWVASTRSMVATDDCSVGRATRPTEEGRT